MQYTRCRYCMQRRAHAVHPDSGVPRSAPPSRKKRNKTTWCTHLGFLPLALSRSVQHLLPLDKLGIARCRGAGGRSLLLRRRLRGRLLLPAVCRCCRVLARAHAHLAAICETCGRVRAAGSFGACQLLLLGHAFPRSMLHSTPSAASCGAAAATAQLHAHSALACAHYTAHSTLHTACTHCTHAHSALACVKHAHTAPSPPPVPHQRSPAWPLGSLAPAARAAPLAA